jgi:hypothetical protein
MDEAARQDATLAAAEAPLPQYFPQTTRTLHQLLSQCSEFVVLTTTRQVVPRCQVRERRSHRFLLRLPQLR